MKYFLDPNTSAGLLSPERNQLGRVILARNVKISAVYLYQTQARGNPNAYSNWIWMQTALANGRNGENQIRYGVNTSRRRREKNWNQIFIDFQPDKPAYSHFNTFYYLFFAATRPARERPRKTTNFLGTRFINSYNTLSFLGFTTQIPSPFLGRVSSFSFARVLSPL